MTKQKSQPRLVEPSSKAEKFWPLIAAGFGALMVLSLLAPVDSISVFVGSALPQNLGWLLLAAMAALASRKSFVQIRPTRAEVLIVGVGLGWLIATSGWSAGHGNGRAVWNGFWQLMALGSCFYVSRALMQFARVRAALTLLLIVGCTALSIEGLEQVFISLPASRADYAKDPDRVLAEQGIDAPPGSPRRKQFEDRLNSPEPFATFALANSLATLLCLGVVLNGGWLANSVSSVTGDRKQELLISKWCLPVGLSITLVAQLICLLLTRSRTSYIALVLSLGLWLTLEVLRGKVRLSGRSLLIGGTLAGGFALLGFGWLLTVDSRVWSEASKSSSYRFQYWQATLAMIREHPWTGVGLGNFQAYYPQYKLEQASEIIADPHNWILDIAATLSVPIAMILVGGIGITLGKGIWKCLVEGSKNVAANSQLDVGHDYGLVGGMIIGAVVGGVCEAALLSLTGSLDFQLTVVAWGIAAALGWLVWRYGAREVSSSNLIAAVVVVLLCLLASGAWQASGIAAPLLALLSMFWQQAPATAVAWQASQTGQPRASSTMASSWVAPTITAAALVIFVVQTWQPVTQSWMWSENALAARSIEEQIRLIELAVAADPLDLDRKLQLVQARAAKAIAVQDPTTFTVEAKLVLEQLDQFAPRDVVGYLTPRLAGQIALDFAAGAAQRGLPYEEYLTSSRGFYSRAVERYPSSVELLVQSAAVAGLLADWPAVAKDIEVAEEISARTPHLDKKLAAQLIWLPISPPGFEGGVGYVPAEPLAGWLRREAKAKLR